MNIETSVKLGQYQAAKMEKKKYTDQLLIIFNDDLL